MSCIHITASKLQGFRWRVASKRLNRYTRSIECSQQQVTIIYEGKNIQMDKPCYIIGSNSSNDIVIPTAQPEHAKLEQRSGRLFLKAKTGDPDSILSSTGVFLQQSELRPGVDYLVAPNSTITLGSTSIIIDFTEQGGSNAMAELLLKGMAGNASDEVKKQLDI
jgi:pSer/pThr/pTyr-binding forkhead associated (FHA) protein